MCYLRSAYCGLECDLGGEEAAAALATVLCSRVRMVSTTRTSTELDSSSTAACLKTRKKSRVRVSTLSGPI